MIVLDTYYLPNHLAYSYFTAVCTISTIFKGKALIFRRAKEHSVVRLGPKRVPSEDNPNPKPIPVKAILRNSIEAGLIKKNARKLKYSDGLKHVGISADKTWKEREEEREIRKVYNQRKFENHEDVVIYNSEVILRSELPSMLKKAKESVSGAGGAAAQKDDRINVGN